VKEQVKKLFSIYFNIFSFSFFFFIIFIILELEFEAKEREREQWEIDNYFDGEKNEMISLFTSRGLPEPRAKKIVNMMSKNKKAFLDIMMVEELGILPHDPDEAPWKSALTTFFAFIFFGAIPLIVYVVGVSVALDSNEPASSSKGTSVWLIACAFVLITLFILGAIQSRFSHQPWWKSGLFIALTGAISAAISYGIGRGLSELVGPLGE
jgi:VIT1/CCC1 family predicted Fe2+/Mn2+ transporter